MSHYIVRLTVVLVHYVEADNPEMAIEHVKGLGVSEYDEIELMDGEEAYTVEENN